MRVSATVITGYAAAAVPGILGSAHRVSSELQARNRSAIAVSHADVSTAPAAKRRLAPLVSHGNAVSANAAIPVATL